MSHIRMTAEHVADVALKYLYYTRFWVLYLQQYCGHHFVYWRLFVRFVASQVKFHNYVDLHCRGNFSLLASFLNPHIWQSWGCCAFFRRFFEKYEEFSSFAKRICWMFNQPCRSVPGRLDCFISCAKIELSFFVLGGFQLVTTIYKAKREVTWGRMLSKSNARF